MFIRLKSLLGWGNAQQAAPAIPDGMRLYAIGDIHGQLDLLHDILRRIEEDHRARSDAELHLMFLGDYVDRGPQSAGVIEFLIKAPSLYGSCHFLKGNHEDAMVRVLEGGRDQIENWLRYGGRETLHSYGISDRVIAMGGTFLSAELSDKVPMAHRHFLNSLEPCKQFGDYVFVHAGIRPNVPLARQDPADLMWIRSPFLDFKGDHGVTVVHGHTVTDNVVVTGNRIGIDTGAYRTGRLSAIGIEGTDRWFLQTR
jgi:serine/threonine protein phosphatase 1